MPSDNEVLKRIRAGARQRRRALERLADAESQLNAAILEGARSGIPKLTLFRESGYGGRQTIYDVIEKGAA
jgi:hypothetical protein